MKEKSNKKLLKKEENRLLVVLSKTEPGSEDYNVVLDQLGKLYNMKHINSETLQKIAPIVLGITGNLAGILLVMNYEKLDIITTKAFGLAYKVRQI